MRTNNKLKKLTKSILIFSVFMAAFSCEKDCPGNIEEIENELISEPVDISFKWEMINIIGSDLRIILNSFSKDSTFYLYTDQGVILGGVSDNPIGSHGFWQTFSQFKTIIDYKYPLNEYYSVRADFEHDQIIVMGHNNKINETVK